MIFLRPYLERFRDKRTSLFCHTLSDEEKSFTTTTLGASLLAGTEPDVVAADVGGGARDGEPPDDVISRRPEQEEVNPESPSPRPGTYVIKLFCP